MENQPDQSVEAYQPRVTVAIIRSEKDLSLYRRAAEIAEGTTIDVLPSDPTAVDAFVADRDASDYPDVDIAARAREALESGATFVRVTEDREFRRVTPGDVWNYHLSLKDGRIK